MPLTCNCLLALSALAWSVAPLCASEFVYSIRDGGFAIHNGTAFYNRPLFGTSEPGMVLSGDRPAFAYLAPTATGKMGNLYLGVITDRGAKWLHEFSSIDTVYQPGWTRHVVSDAVVPGGEIEVGLVPLATAEGFTVRLKWRKPTAEKVTLVWLYGGASGAGTDTRAPLPLEQIHLKSADASRNVVSVWGEIFSLTAPSLNSGHVVGRCDLEGRLEGKAAEASLGSPAHAVRAPLSATSVAVFHAPWPSGRTTAHLLFVMNSVEESEKLARDPAGTFDRALDHYRRLAGQARVKTPDPHFDLAVEAMVIANDGIWRSPAFLHGATSWMIPYLGWRGWYGPEALGFHDRVRSAILAFAAKQVQRGEERGGIPHTLFVGNVFYNMAEVYLDQIYYHYQWTGDRKLLASLFPVIEGILAWEKRRLDPDGNSLYESCLNTWISDSHWYNGGDTTQASSYMYRANLLAADAAAVAGRDAEPYRREAAAIRTRMNEKLWLAASGHYIEFIDRIGLKRPHLEPELPTIYHPIEFGLADPFQAYQMLRFTETALVNERDLPGGGRLAWSSRWAPNSNRSYTHSTYELAFGEQLNLAIAYYRAGQYEQAYDLIKGSYAPMFQGAVPGGISSHAYSNGAQRGGPEFADGLSMFARAAVEGVFGILPEMQNELIHISPGFPAAWNDASITTPDLTYTFHKTASSITMEAATARDARIHFRIPLLGADAVEAWVNGSRAEAHLEAGIGRAFLDVTGPRGRKATLRVTWKPRRAVVLSPAVVATGESFTVTAEGTRIRELKDPQRVLDQVRREEQSLTGTVTGSTGHRTLFVLTDAGEWHAIHVEVRPPLEIRDARVHAATGGCRFALRNNTDRPWQIRMRVRWAGVDGNIDGVLPPHSANTYRAAGDGTALLPGTNVLEVENLTAEVPYWPEAKGDGLTWRTVSLEPHFSESLPTVLLRNFWSTEVPYAVCRDYAIDHLKLFGIRMRIPDDSRLRSEVNAQGLFVTRYGIPFAQRREGNNMVALSRWPGHPTTVKMVVRRPARRVYLLLSALAFPTQSHIANARVTLHYEDGGQASTELENPRNLDNGWGTLGGTWHYTANGMELLSLPKTYMQRPPVSTVLEQHEVWKAAAPPPAEWEERPHADIVSVACDAGRHIRSIEVEVLSQDIIVGLFGLTLLE